MRNSWRMMLILLLGTGLVLGGFPAAFGQDEEGEKEEEKDMEEFVLEEVVVTSERGEIMILDRPMTVTGFNEQMVEQLGIQNEGDLEVLVPGLQIGNRTQGGGKGENDHFYMRGVGSERTVNFFSDTSVAVYVDGVWTDQTYGTDGFFDMERVEVARGPQGTTGGKNALSGAINFYSRKPTSVFDAYVKSEFTDQSTQQYQTAFGGPIMDTDFSYRLKFSYLTGDGQIENVFSGGRDGGEPEQFIWAPAFRWKTNRWDITVRYSDQKDTGTPMVSLPLGAVNSVDEFILGPDGNPVCAINPATGLEECRRNPYFGANASPAVANCSNISNDGTSDPSDTICDPDELEYKVALNAPIYEDNAAKATSVDAVFNITDNLVLNYKFGWRDTVSENLNDSDQLPRTGGGICPWDHPKVLGGMLTAGQTSPYCALDGGGDGSFVDNGSLYRFTSEQYSNELSFYSTFDGGVNFVVGVSYIDGEEPYDWRGYNFNTGSDGKWLNEDTSAQCEAAIEGLYGPGGSATGFAQGQLMKDRATNPDAEDITAWWSPWVVCPGDPVITQYAAGTNFTANPNGQSGLFAGGAFYESLGFYANVDYVINDQWTVFAGIRNDTDKKGRTLADYFYINARRADDLSQVCGVTEANDGTDCVSFIEGWIRGGLAAGLEPRYDLEWDGTTWNVGAEYRPIEDTMVYGRISTGYRAGGSMGFAHIGPPWQYDSEEMINYELGVKGLYLDNTLQLEVSYFFQDFSAYWVFAQRIKSQAEMAMDPDGGPLTGEVNSIDGTTIGGIELQFAWRFLDAFTFRGFYNWLDASIGDYNTMYPYTIPGVAADWQWVTAPGGAGAWINMANIMNLGGNQPVNQPEHKSSLTLAWDTPIPENLGSLEAVSTYNYTGKKYVEVANIDAYAIEPYHRWDIRLNWRSPSQKYLVVLYVQNALDQAGILMWSPREGVGSPWGTMAEPREIGLSISYRIGG